MVSFVVADLRRTEHLGRQELVISIPVLPVGLPLVPE